MKSTDRNASKSERLVDTRATSPRKLPPMARAIEPVKLTINGPEIAADGFATAHSYPLDGRDLMPVLTGEAPTSERALYWRMGNRQQRAVRRNDWKYRRVAEREFLSDLAYDPRKRGNLAGKEPAQRSVRTRKLNDLNHSNARTGQVRLEHTVSHKAEAAYRQGDLL